MAFHNLCSSATPPPGLANLLSMGLKYCIKSPNPYQELDNSIKRIQCSIQFHFCFAEQDMEEDEADNLSVSKDPNVTTKEARKLSFLRPKLRTSNVQQRKCTWAKHMSPTILWNLQSP
jgi:hypothetical protein